MKKIVYDYYVGDFETTVYDGQTETEVWASALVKMNTEDVLIFHSIDETFNYLKSLKKNVCVYYHNLKFDGNFWLSYLMKVLHYKQAFSYNDKGFPVSALYDSDMTDNSFKYVISNMGIWYTMTIKTGGKIIELRDSLKLLPFSVRKLGESFGTKHKKLDMEYTGFRYAGCGITDEEKRYIANDVLVVKEALEIMFEEGHKKTTIGTCCLDEYKKIIGRKDYETMFPNLYDIKINKELYQYENAGDYIRRSYKGGWCYLVRGCENKLITNGITLDVNSLYPSMMSGESKNIYPWGIPTFWKGNYIPEEALAINRYYFVRIKTRFYLKKNMLPTIQIKNNYLYNGNEWLMTSDIYNHEDGKYYRQCIGYNGEVEQAIPILTLTMTDFQLLKDHYVLEDFEILDGCWFYAQSMIFDDYIFKYKQIKMNSTGARRELAKLFLNNLYGKMATSTNSSFKYAYLKEDNNIGFKEVEQFEKKPGYIAVGSAITSYARNFTIRAAQKNYYGKDKHGFIYADTDSIHCNLTEEELQGVKIDSKEFCCWKLETKWDVGLFVRQKTYLERVIEKDGKNLDEPKYNIKCAGMPEKCKKLFLFSVKNISKEKWETEHKEEWDKFTKEEKEFVLKQRTIEDFKKGLIVPGKLLPKRIDGGVVLIDTTYEMR